METTGSRRLQTKPDALFRALDRAATLQSCIPGCDSISGSIAEGYNFTVSQKIGPFPVTVRGTASFARAAPDAGYVLDVTMSGRLSGQVTARLVLALTPRPRATLLDYQATMEASTILKMAGPERVQRAFAAGVNGFIDRLKAAAEV